MKDHQGECTFKKEGRKLFFFLNESYRCLTSDQMRSMPSKRLLIILTVVVIIGSDVIVCY